MSRVKSAASTGQRTTAHTVSQGSTIPTAAATRFVVSSSTAMPANTASRNTASTSMSPRNFQIWRPSCTSYTEFTARPKAVA